MTHNALSGAAGSAPPTACIPSDNKDTLPDRIDEDCDGKIDEDVDASRASCPLGMHIIEGTRGDDVIHGTPGRDCILGYGGNDTIYGEAGDDLIFGGAGDDHIFTGRGNAIVHAGAGNDVVDTSGGFASTVFGEAGEDQLIGGSGPDLFYGGDDDDILNGGGGPDVLNGDGCHDLIVGGSGFDYSVGGPDFDACDSELSSQCEKLGNKRVLCHADTDCQTSERCAEFSGFCVPRSAAACSLNHCVSTSSVDTTCNGVDDDCDGKIDDDYVAHSTPCGEGACAASGMTSCVNGTVQDSCRAGTPTGDDSTCDKIDDDCDGHVDEGFVGGQTHCGEGACASSGATSCVNGTIVDSCHAGSSSLPDSTCDGNDDDCDGLVDEAFVPTTVACGVGFCARSGMTQCVGGHLVATCEAGLPEATDDATCDGIDDDCDGVLDEDFASAAVSCGVGVCARTGASSCIAGAVVDSCVAGAPTAAVDDSCNGLDDDCNGSVDDAYQETPTSCGFGMCQVSGHLACQQGQVVDTCTVLCEGQCNDGAEDDHDGLIDCADPDCANQTGCVTGSYGSPCAADSQCDRIGSQATCVTGFPGGYCSRQCSSDANCPTGTFCLNNIACVVACGPGDHCGRAGYACSAVPGLGSALFCHPSCALSCPSGQTCNPTTSQCE